MPDKSKSIVKQLAELNARLSRLEAAATHARSHHLTESDGGADEHHCFCSMPDVPERAFGPDVSPFRARLLRWIEKKWVNGTKLRYYFFEDAPDAGGPEQLDMVREGFEVWKNVGIGITFEEVQTITDAEIRIGFRRGDGAWSYLGRDVIDIPGRYERTMNFGWDLTRDPRGVDTPVHEIGHTLGFPHEHQNPFSGIVWDEQAVYNYFGGPPNNWTRESTYYNVLRKLSSQDVEGSQWDPDSVMHYGFPSGLILSPPEYRNGLTPALGLSEHDIAEVKRFYPPINDDQNARLEPFRLELLSLEPAQQKNYTIEPTRTDEYTIQTFGRSDTVMILFEQVNNELRFVGGDDDSGTGYNARIRARLQQGRRYVLRVRLYLNYASGDTALLMW